MTAPPGYVRGAWVCQLRFENRIEETTAGGEVSPGYGLTDTTS